MSHAPVFHGIGTEKFAQASGAQGESPFLQMTHIVCLETFALDGHSRKRALRAASAIGTVASGEKRFSIEYLLVTSPLCNGHGHGTAPTTYRAWQAAAAPRQSDAAMLATFAECRNMM